MSKEQFLLQRVDSNEIKIANEVYSCRLSPFDADLQKVSQYLTQAILLEVSTHPKPGLVTRLSNGAHKDMSIFTFMMSSAVLSKAFNDLQDIGQAHRGTLAELFCKLRSYGVGAEAELLRVTKGVNTQRGSERCKRLCYEYGAEQRCFAADDQGNGCRLSSQGIEES